MKTSRRTIYATLMLLLTIGLLSWNFNKPKKETAGADLFVGNDAFSPANLQLLSLIEEADRYDKPGKYQLPGAEDVLVKRIPGDNNHLIMMAYYSKKSFSAPSFTIENGQTIEFKDDGKGFDEKAGDGLYTARIDVDVKEFRKQALDMLKKMKANGYKPFRYVNREYMYDPEVENTFTTQAFDANSAVSISGITNALATTDDDLTLLERLRKNSVIMTDPSVVEDTLRTWNFCAQKGNVNGVWTFGSLMRQLASKDPQHIVSDSVLSVFVKDWLNQWAITQVINGDTAAARTLVNNQILNPWLSASRNAGSPKGHLDMRFAPFRLTAILNRFDLRAGTKFAETDQFCGQGRFVFCLIKSNCTSALSYTAIFEYSIFKGSSCEEMKSWAQQWFDLNELTLGSAEYNQALQAITDQFTQCGSNPGGIHQSSLAQLRTNDLTLSPAPKQWELREFKIDNSTGLLKQVTVAQTPADKYNAKVINDDVQRFAKFVNQNRADITAGAYHVPAEFQGFGFLGAASKILGQPTGAPPKPYHWNGTDSTNKPTFIQSHSARSNFSFQTCSGCHAGETQTAFTHIDTAFFGRAATLSGFLTGKAGFRGIDSDGDSTNGQFTIKDPALRPTPENPIFKTFNEINRRAADIKSVVSTSCGSPLAISSELMFKPVNMVH